VLQHVSEQSHRATTTTQVAQLRREAQTALSGAVKAKAIRKEEAAEIEEELRHQLFTRFGTRTESSAVAQYERQTGNAVFGRNDRRLVWPFPELSEREPGNPNDLEPPPELAQGWGAGQQRAFIRRVREVAQGLGPWIVLGGEQGFLEQCAKGGLEAWERAGIHKEAEAQALRHVGVNLPDGAGRTVVVWREGGRGWCYSDRAGVRQGPFPNEMMREWHAAGWLPGNTLIHTVGMDQPRPMDEVFPPHLFAVPFASEPQGDCVGAAGGTALLWEAVRLAEDGLEGIAQYDSDREEDAGTGGGGVRATLFQIIGSVDGVSDEVRAPLSPYERIKYVHMW